MLRKNENERDIIYLSYFEVRFISISVPKNIERESASGLSSDNDWAWLLATP